MRYEEVAFHSVHQDPVRAGLAVHEQLVDEHDRHSACSDHLTQVVHRERPQVGPDARPIGQGAEVALDEPPELAILLGPQPFEESAPSVLTVTAGRDPCPAAATAWP
jgi:hypothetical protein